MKTVDLTADQVRACVMKCPVKLTKRNGTVLASSGDYYAMPAKSEPMKPYWRAAKKDLRDRELRGGSYKGDLGHVVIGGHRFSLYPKSGMLIRDDYALWCDAHADEYIGADGRERIATETPDDQKVETVDPMLHQWKDIRRRAMDTVFTGLVNDGGWNTLYDMKQTLSQYSLEIVRDKKAGRRLAVTKIQADLLAALIAYRERHMKDSVDFFLDLSSAALMAARLVQEESCGHKTGEAEAESVSGLRDCILRGEEQK